MVADSVTNGANLANRADLSELILQLKGALVHFHQSEYLVPSKAVRRELLLTS